MTEELDISWIQEEERILSGTPLEPEPIRQIHMAFVYINQNDYIDNVKQEVKTLDNHSTISVNELLAIIQKHKLTTPTSKYRIIDLLLFHVDVDVPLLEGCEPTLKNINMIHDIVLKPSVLIFHNLNTLYFIFKEAPLVMNNPARSILKASVPGAAAAAAAVPAEGAKKTKRVKLPVQRMNRITKKQLDDPPK
jgi:hypothetical protein